MSFRYRLFGLPLSSEIDLPLPDEPDTVAPDVVIRQGAVAVAGDLLWQTARPVVIACYQDGGEVVLDWPGARFRIGRSEIVVDAADVRLAQELLLHAVWSVVLELRGQAALHGAAVAN